MKKVVLRAAIVLGIVYCLFVGAIAWAMAQPPDTFGQFMARMPILTFLVAPFETLWTHIRAGALHPGDAAPDFNLKRLDHTGEVRLSSLRGQPVVLVFGSYT